MHYESNRLLAFHLTVPVNKAVAPGGVAKRDPPVWAQCCVHAAPVCHILSQSVLGAHWNNFFVCRTGLIYFIPHMYNRTVLITHTGFDILIKDQNIKTKTFFPVFVGTDVDLPFD